MMFKNGVMFISGLAALSVGPVSAAELELSLGGTAFRGAPAFQVKAGDVLIGEGEVADPGSPGGQSFRFQLDETVMSSTPEVRIYFTNDLGVTGEGDRNLYVLGAAINGEAIPLHDIVIEQDGVAVRNDGKLFGEKQVAVIPFPEEPSTKDEPQLTAQSVSEPSDAQVECATTQIDVTGFANGAVQLVPPQLEMLESVEGGENCTLTITGYSSTAGSSETNMNIAAARAAAVRASLEESGTFAEVTVSVVGETEQFGPDQSANRRVTVVVGPLPQ